MNIGLRRMVIVMFLGDIACFFASLCLMLIIRYGGLLNMSAVSGHIIPFSILFFVWAVVFMSAGLYEYRALITPQKTYGLILNSQIVNVVIAIIFFYFIPYFGITPKTNLFIYLVISFVLILSWRIVGVYLFNVKKSQNALLVGAGNEMKELAEEVNSNPRYGIRFKEIDVANIPLERLAGEITGATKDARLAVIDITNEKVVPLLPSLYNLLFNNIQIAEMHKTYETVFNRIPLSLIGYEWILENIEVSPKLAYDFLKRLMDIALAVILGVISLVLYPFIIIAIKIDDGGPIFFAHDRVGKNDKLFKIYKFRSYPVHEGPIASEKKLTRVGGILRKTHIDELPQLWSVLKGDLSLIGPRPELPVLVKKYESEISYYKVRHLIKPGLSGWAQIYQTNPPKFEVGYSETKIKLSYDLYYIKNRSFILDILIALRTVKTLLTQKGI